MLILAFLFLLVGGIITIVNTVRVLKEDPTIFISFKERLYIKYVIYGVILMILGYIFGIISARH